MIPLGWLPAVAGSALACYELNELGEAIGSDGWLERVFVRLNLSVPLCPFSRIMGITPGLRMQQPALPLLPVRGPKRCSRHPIAR